MQVSDFPADLQKCRELSEKPYLYVMDKYYRHFKGGVYRFIGTAKHSETQEEMVVYEAMYGGHQMWVRPKEMFFGKVEWDGNTIPRFHELTDEEALGMGLGILDGRNEPPL